MQKQVLPEEEEDFIHQNSDDAYVEDELPDLVLDTRKISTSSSLGESFFLTRGRL